MNSLCLSLSIQLLAANKTKQHFTSEFIFMENNICFYFVVYEAKRGQLVKNGAGGKNKINLKYAFVAFLYIGAKTESIQVQIKLLIVAHGLRFHGAYT